MAREFKVELIKLFREIYQVRLKLVHESIILTIKPSIVSN